MKLTNHQNLPQAIYDAVANDRYTKGDADISVTELLSPPQQAALKHEFKNLIEEDASDRIWSLVGQVMHGILERANRTGIAERRLSIEVEGWKLSGGMDLMQSDGTLSDYKFVTAYKFKNNEVPREYEEQLNVYVEILRQNEITVEKAEIIGILRDWSKLEARRDPGYPQSQVIRLSVPLWDRSATQKFIRERIILHKQARVSQVPCTPEDRWEKPTVYAVMKPGRKSAVRLFESEAEAETFATPEGFGYYVVKRPGASVRCENYCSVSKFCSQYQATRVQEEIAVTA